jgi:hypothetical protein
VLWDNAAVREVFTWGGIALCEDTSLSGGAAAVGEAIGTPPSPPVDAVEAIRAGWLELWYQPKVDTQMLALRGAEGLIRIPA